MTVLVGPEILRHRRDLSVALLLHTFRIFALAPTRGQGADSHRVAHARRRSADVHVSDNVGFDLSAEGLRSTAGEKHHQASNEDLHASSPFRVL